MLNPCRGPAFAGDALEDDRQVAHRASDEATLPWECGCRALSYDDHLFTVVIFLPRAVVVVVDEIKLHAAEHLHDLAGHPLAAGVGVLPREGHLCFVARPAVRCSSLGTVARTCSTQHGRSSDEASLCPMLHEMVTASTPLT